MANAFYTVGSATYVADTFDWEGSTVRALLVRDTYTFDAAHSTLADIPASARLADAAVTGRTEDDGTVRTSRAADTRLTGTATRHTIRAIVLYKTELSNQLLCYFDDAFGLPTQEGGGPLIVKWNDGVVVRDGGYGGPGTYGAGTYSAEALVVGNPQLNAPYVVRSGEGFELTNTGADRALGAKVYGAGRQGVPL